MNYVDRMNYATREQYKKFLVNIGVSDQGKATTYSEAADEYPGLPGYIKFYGSGCHGSPPAEGERPRDWQLADQFQAWLVANKLSFFRGYPHGEGGEYTEDHPRERDRRFFLGHDAVAAVRRAYEAVGLTAKDIDNA